MRTVFLATLLLLPSLTFAQYSPMVGIGVDPNTDFSSYINSIYALAISLAALLAVIKIVIAGVKWMTTDVVTSKGEAKKDIQGALVGLIIVLSAVLIINIINPQITNVSLSLGTPSSPSGGAGTTPTLTATVNSYAMYESVDSNDPQQIELFFDSCDPASYQVFHGSINEARCYDLPPGATGVVLVKYTTRDVGQGQGERRESETEDICSGIGGFRSEPDPRIATNAAGFVSNGNPGHLLCYVN